MNRKSEVVYLSQLKDVQILWAGDIRSLAEFILRSRDATDKITNAKNRGSVQKSRPTLHGLARDFANIVDIPILQIEMLLKDHGLSLGATVEFDILKLVTSDQ